MPLVKQITRIGNSHGIILDSVILKMLGWSIDTEVSIQVKDDRIIVRPAEHSKK